MDATIDTYLRLIFERNCEAWVRHLLKQCLCKLEKDQNLLFAEDWVPGVQVGLVELLFILLCLLKMVALVYYELLE